MNAPSESELRKLGIEGVIGRVHGLNQVLHVAIETVDGAPRIHACDALAVSLDGKHSIQTIQQPLHGRVAGIGRPSAHRKRSMQGMS